MGYIQGEGRNQGILFPVVLDDFVPADHVCRVIDAFVEMLVQQCPIFSPQIQRTACGPRVVPLIFPSIFCNSARD
jgi:hypothetical protein